MSEARRGEAREALQKRHLDVVFEKSNTANIDSILDEKLVLGCEETEAR